MAQQRKTAEIRVDLSGLEELKRKLGRKYITRVGILGGAGMHKEPITKMFNGKATRVAGPTEQPLSNAEIGLILELGSETNNIPPASWLRMPAEYKKREIIKFLGTPKIRALIEGGNILGVFKALGVFVEGIIDDAFSSQGWGKWPKNAASTIKRKGSSARNIDTGQVRRAVTSDVVERGP